MARHKTEAINLRMSPQMKAMLRLAAEREHRTLSNMIEHLLIDYCERNAIDAPQSKSSKRGANGASDT